MDPTLMRMDVYTKAGNHFGRSGEGGKKGGWNPSICGFKFSKMSWPLPLYTRTRWFPSRLLGGPNIRRPMMSQCPSLVRFILVTRSRICPVSPLYSFNFPLETIEQSVERYFETMQWSSSLYNLPLILSIHWSVLTEPAFTMMLGKWLFPMQPLLPHLSVDDSYHL